MRTLNPYLVLIALLFSAISCTVDQEPIIENDSSNFIIETSGSDQTTQGGERFYDPLLSPESIELENHMQWVSYIAAAAIHNNPEARERVIDQITPVPGPVAEQKPSVLINDLLGSDIPDTDPFKDAFRRSYNYFLLVALDCIRPGGATATPPPGSNPPGNILNPNTINNFKIANSNETATIDPDCFEYVESLRQEFMNTIINKNCLELYFPNGITDTEYRSVTSTAHPLVEGVNENTGYFRHWVSISTFGVIIEVIQTDEITVDQSYINTTNDLVIVARPKKNRRCLYSEYNFDFTNFLQ
ncbi:hypothetical protein [uncultured Dokdonia sp.]|uniref:hypothetical protein n=1 Tax=uncultured Dokdonia sp. TaxID=575653 RepID=UPI002602887A|nr:hypothetical protein [uncultured Dokdonia sp.]